MPCFPQESKLVLDCHVGAVILREILQVLLDFVYVFPDGFGDKGEVLVKFTAPNPPSIIQALTHNSRAGQELKGVQILSISQHLCYTGARNAPGTELD